MRVSAVVADVFVFLCQFPSSSAARIGRRPFLTEGSLRWRTRTCDELKSLSPPLSRSPCVRASLWCACLHVPGEGNVSLLILSSVVSLSFLFLVACCHSSCSSPPPPYTAVYGTRVHKTCGPRAPPFLSRARSRSSYAFSFARGEQSLSLFVVTRDPASRGLSVCRGRDQHSALPRPSTSIRSRPRPRGEQRSRDGRYGASVPRPSVSRSFRTHRQTHVRQIST